METLVGYAFAWMLGNQDVLIILCSFTGGLSLLYTVLMAWKYSEDGD